MVGCILLSLYINDRAWFLYIIQKRGSITSVSEHLWTTVSEINFSKAIAEGFYLQIRPTAI